MWRKCTEITQESLILDLKAKFPKNDVNMALLFDLFSTLGLGKYWKPLFPKEDESKKDRALKGKYIWGPLIICKNKNTLKTRNRAGEVSTRQC